MDNMTRRKKLQELAGNWGVEQVTFDPIGKGRAVRLHLHPAKFGPSLLFINSQYILRISPGPAMLLRIFMQELKKVANPGQEIDDEKMRLVLDKVNARMHDLYPDVPNHKSRFEGDIDLMEKIIFAVANGERPSELEGVEPISLAEYAPQMTGPFRMDLAVMPMRVDGTWVCNNACGACYAMTGDAMKVNAQDLLTTDEWKIVLDKLWKVAGVSQVSFTGGEPTERNDLSELIAYAQEFTTRLNTNGRKMADIGYCRKLKGASLDVVQVTVYSSDATIHNTLVGAKGAWFETMAGIKNALAVGLEVSVNIPLVEANVRGLAETIRFLNKSLGVRYFTCSGLLPAGGAKKLIASGRSAAQTTLYKELRRAKAMVAKLNVELDFTSPGSLTPAQLEELGFNSPVCGACLGNMAVSPAGKLLPCQSWVHDAAGLGDMIKDSWVSMWNGPKCKEIRARAADRPECPLAMEVK